MPEENVSVKFSSVGAPELSRQIEDVTQRMVAATTAAKLNYEIQQAMVDLSKTQQTAFGGLIDSLKNVHAQYQQGGMAAQGLGSATSVLGAAMGALTSPIGIATIALGAFAAAVYKSSEAALAAFREIRNLQAMSGMGAEAAEQLSNAFKLAGVEGDRLGMAFFRLGNELETGGKHLRLLGIGIRDSHGAMKEEGDLLLEVRDKISGIGDASARNAALIEIFGRAGRSLGPAFALPREEFAKLMGVAKDTSVVTEEFMAQSLALARAQEELAQRQKKVNLEFAMFVAIPIETTLLKIMEVAAKVPKAIVDMLAVVFGGKTTAEVEAMEAAEAAAKKVDDFKKQQTQTKEANDRRMTQTELQEAQTRLRTQFEQDEKRLLGETKVAGEISKIRTGSAVGALQLEIKTNEQRIQAAEELFNKEVDLERRRAFVAGVDADPQVVARLEKQRDDVTVRLREENKLKLFEIDKAGVEDTKRLLDERIKIMKVGGEQEVAILKNAREQALVMNQEAYQTTISRTIEQNRIEEGYARTTRDSKIGMIKEEEAALRDFAARYPENFSVQREVTDRLLTLSVQRTNAELEADKEILDSRKKLVDGLKQQADREAGIGDELTNKAIARLEKRGKRFASASDVINEAAKIQDEEQQKAFAYGTGQRVATSDIGELLKGRRLATDIAAQGTTVAGAIGQSVQQTAYGYAGYTGGYMPSNVQRSPFGEGPTEVARSADPIVQAYQAAFAKIPTAFDKSLAEVGKKIDEGWQQIESRIVPKVVDAIVRNLEIDSSRGSTAGGSS